MENNGAKSRTATFFLCVFFGVLGVHRFYVGKVWTGIFYILTGGIVGVGVVVDLIRIVFGGFPDADGNSLSKWPVLGFILAVIMLAAAAATGIIVFIIGLAV